MANYVYARAANVKFGSDESSIKAQVGKFKDIKIDKVYKDTNISGQTLKREGLENMLKDLKSGDNIYVANISRMTRDTTLLFDLIETIDHVGAKLHSDDLPGHEISAYMKKYFIEGGKQNGKARNEPWRRESGSY